MTKADTGPLRHLVLGTAGHVDHGKSELVRALTGIDPDRLEEEKRRGITIELGFADLELDSGRVLSFVDVPGHERFVRHMVAGATGIDAVLLVVAADQGVEPQTREHLDICSLLSVRRGVVALTKCDLVDRELQDVVALEVRELLAGTFLAEAPLVHVSARSGEGLDALRQALGRLLEEQPPRSAEGVVRLPVDRSFVLKGFGTVVTGTLVSGTLREGDEVEILPGGKRGRIRGLQVHRHGVSFVAAGQRTAVNVQGLDQSEVARGTTITSPGALLTTRRVWARLDLLPGAPEKFEKGGWVRFHQGTAERPARLRMLDRAPDGARLVELRLGDEAVLAPRDRFILRRPAPVDTIGGGVVVDVRPGRYAGSGTECLALENLEPAAALKLRLERSGAAGRDVTGLRSELGLSEVELARAIEHLADSGDARLAASRWFDGGLWRRLGGLVVEALVSFHEQRPLHAGISREALRARVCREMPQESWREMLEGLRAEGRLRLEGELVATGEHRVVLAGEELDLARKIDRTYRDAGLEPPDLDQVVGPDEAERAGPIVELLIAERKLVRIQDGRLFHLDALERLRALLRDYARSSPTIDVASFKKLAGVTRKNAIPLLEQLDAERTTRRKGNIREILVSE